MSHHPSCTPNDKDLVWLCAQCGERESAEELLSVLLEALRAAQSHLEYCNYGDRWERECANESKLPEQIESAIAKIEEFNQPTKGEK